MKHLSITLCAAAVAVAFAVPASAENIVFQQVAATDFDAIAWISTNVVGHPDQGITAYDNFSLASSTTLGSVQWNGEFNQNANPVTGFTLTIYGNYDPTGTPGFAVYQEHVAGLANQAVYGFDDFTLCDEASYSASINFQASANTKYWLSIVGDADRNSDYGWSAAVEANGSAYQSGDLQIFSPYVPTDLAFTLFDNAVDPLPPPPPTIPTAATPEPSSLMLLGTGVLGVAGTVRRRFARKG